MTTTQIKSFLHESIENIDDPEFLQMIKEIVEDKYSPPELQLTQWQKDRIEESKRQIKEGKFLTNEEADALVEKWLNESPGH